MRIFILIRNRSFPKCQRFFKVSSCLKIFWNFKSHPSKLLRITENASKSASSSKRTEISHNLRRSWRAWKCWLDAKLAFLLFYLLCKLPFSRKDLLTTYSEFFLVLYHSYGSRSRKDSKLGLEIPQSFNRLDKVVVWRLFKVCLKIFFKLSKDML